MLDIPANDHEGQAQAKAADGGNNQLFKWVAWFTGSKNAMKGFGFFLGGVLLQALGFQHSLWAMAGLLVLVLAGVVLSVPPLMGKAKASKSAKELFAKNQGINQLAAARVALFGARDVWFVVGVPVFLYSQGWNFTMVGGFLAAWTIGYGLVQALAPNIVKRSPDGLSSEVPAALTPRPTSAYASIASATPAQRALPIHAVATAPPKPPSASTAMPPRIHGVRRLPRSLP